MSPSTVVGSAEIIIRANSTGFASEIRAETNPAFANLTSDAETAGEDAGGALRSGVANESGGIASDLGDVGMLGGANLREGVKDGTKDIEKDLEETGEAGGGKFSKGIAGAFSSLGNVASNFMPGLGKTMSETGEKAAGMGEKVEGAGGILGKIPVPAAIAAGAIIAIGVEAFKAGEAMQTADAAIAVASGSTVKAATAIGNAFLSTAGKSEFSGQEMAEAYGPVAGQLKAAEGHILTTAEAMSVMNAAADLATAKQISLGTATSTVASIMQAFQLPASQAAHATDVLFNASNATGQGVDTVGAAFDKVRAKMGAFAPSLGQMGGLLVDMTNHGETGRAAMTALGSVFTGLLPPIGKLTSAQQQTVDLQKKYGLSFETSNGKMKDMGAIIAEVAPVISGMGDAQAVSTLKALGFGSASQTLLTTIRAGPTAYNAATAAVTKTGSAHAAAGVEAQTLGVEFKTLKATVEDWMTQLGERLIPIVTKVADWLGKMLPGAISIFKLVWSGLSVVLVPVIDILKAVFKFLDEHKPILYAVAAAVALVVAPWLVLIVVIAEVKKHWAAILDFFKNIWDSVKRYFDDAVHFVKMILLNFTPEGLIFSHWTSIVGFFEKLLSDVVGFFTALPGEIVAGLGDIVGTIWAGLSGAGKWVEDNVITPVIGFFTGLPGSIVKGLGNIVKTIWGGLTGAATWVTTNVITPVVGFFTGLPGRIVTALGNIVGTIWHGLLGAALWVYNNVELPVLGFFAGLPGKIVGALGDIVGTIWAGLTGAAAWVGTNVITPVVNFFTSLPGKIVKAVGSGLSVLLGWGKDIATGIGNGIATAASTIGTALLNAMKSALHSLVGFVKSIPVVGGVISGALGAIGIHGYTGHVDKPQLSIIGDEPEWIITDRDMKAMSGQKAPSMPSFLSGKQGAGGGSGGFRDLYLTMNAASMSPQQAFVEAGWALKTGAFSTVNVAA